MSSTIRVASLILLVLVFAAHAQLHIKSTLMKELEEFSSNFVNQIDTDPSNNDECTTPLVPGESFARTVSENVTSGYLNVGSGTSTALFFVFYKCRNLASSVNPNSTADFTSVPVVIWLQGGIICYHG